MVCYSLSILELGKLLTELLPFRNSWTRSSSFTYSIGKAANWFPLLSLSKLLLLLLINSPEQDIWAADRSVSSLFFKEVKTKPLPSPPFSRLASETSHLVNAVSCLRLSPLSRVFASSPYRSQGFTPLPLGWASSSLFFHSAKQLRFMILFLMLIDLFLIEPGKAYIFFLLYNWAYERAKSSYRSHSFYSSA